VLKMSVTICPNCGTQNPTGSKFCLKCGAYFNESEDIDKTKKLERKEKKKKREPILTHDMIPFIGDSVIESENFTTGGDATVGCGAASSDRFNIYFQQRNKLIVNIEEEGEVLEDSSMDGLRAFILPNLLKERYSRKELIDIYVNPPMKDMSSEEHYDLKSYTGNENINFGYILFASPNIEFDDQLKIESESGMIISKYVIPIYSKISYDVAMKQDMPAVMYPVDMEWNTIKNKFMDDDEIKYALFARDETKFRWEHPISLKIEIEDSNISMLKAFDDKQSKWRTPGTPLVRTSRLATVKITLSNTTYYQIFYSALKNVDLYINFDTTYKELVQPSALIFETPGAEYILEEKAINWRVTQKKELFHPGEPKELIFHIDRDIIDKIDGFHVNISGMYESNPQMFNSYRYITPMGFPVKIMHSTIKKGSSKDIVDIEWNPGRVQLQELKTVRQKKTSSEIPFYIPDDSKVTDYFDEFQPGFFQEVIISKANLKKSIMQRNYVETLNKGNEFIIAVEENVKKMGGDKKKEYVFREVDKGGSA
jgi:hypothetical protein